MSAPNASRQFVGEPIQPVPGTADVLGMTRGEPGLPVSFTWRGKPFTVAEVLERWRQTGPCSHGSAEQYVRKHWYRIRTTDGTEMRIYFERQARSARSARARKARWWLFTLSERGE